MSTGTVLDVNSSNWGKLPALLSRAAKDGISRLYVRLDDGLLTIDNVTNVYTSSTENCGNVDVRVLLKADAFSHQFDRRLDGSETITQLSPRKEQFSRVVLGGTFDRIHNGHKVLLSTAALLASTSITCGITGKAMIEKKQLWELITPFEERSTAAKEFVKDVTGKDMLITHLLEDPFGPSIVETDLEAIVVSAETAKGGAAVNEKRKEKGLSILDVHEIGLLKADDKVMNESKVSSSSRRHQLLGHLLKPVTNRIAAARRPYIIGLTGGIASGKSNIAKTLASPDFADLNKGQFDVIDCDKLGHELYAPGSELVQLLSDRFPGVVDGATGQLDRKKLGAVVFSNPANREELNKMVWPLIKKRVYERIASTTKPVVVVEAAAIVEAGWHEEFAELWVAMVPPEEAIRRTIERDKLPEEQARARLSSQLSNKARVDKAHVVFCSLWAYEETRRQLAIAVEQLRDRAGL